MAIFELSFWRRETTMSGNIQTPNIQFKLDLAMEFVRVLAAFSGRKEIAHWHATDGNTYKYPFCIEICTIASFLNRKIILVIYYLIINPKQRRREFPGQFIYSLPPSCRI